jgi:predicted site-specific integrase-resolvase
MDEPRLLSLPDWAKREYGDKAPHIGTLRRWANEGRITPQPTKSGKTWFVVPTAKYSA